MTAIRPHISTNSSQFHSFATMSIFLALRFESMFSGLTSHLQGRVDYVTNKFYPLTTFPNSEP